MNLRRIALGTLMLVVVWLAASQIAWWIAEGVGGYALAEDTLPYRNAHLIEDASEGAYNPALDPRFLLGSVLPTAVAFALTSFWLGRRNWRPAALVGGIGAALLCLVHWNVIAGGLPTTVKAALALHVSLAILGSAAGTAAAARLLVGGHGLGAPAGGPTMR